MVADGGDRGDDADGADASPGMGRPARIWSPTSSPSASHRPPMPESTPSPPNGIDLEVKNPSVKNSYL